MTSFDQPGTTDNRAYDYSQWPTQWRAEYPYIERWVPHGARVIDLGCGNGSLLELLKRSKQIQEFGIELAESGVAQCRRKGLNVRPGRIDGPLADIADDAFDIAICNVTIQMVMYPEVLVREMRRIAPVQIISFPNFACYRNRLDFLLRGRMPRPMLFGYTWYSTGHIHQLSLLDFYDLCAEIGLQVVDAVLARSRHMVFNLLCRRYPNLFTAIPILKLARTAPAREESVQ
jgi:methionine biosynthesis protein MetW